VKRFITKIASIFLASVVLFSTASFSVNKHYCCNELVDTSILGSAKTCGMKDIKTSTKKCFIEDDDDCCTTKTFIKKGNDNLMTVSLELETESFFFLQSLLYTYINLFEGLQENIVPFKNYTPPLISKDILVLHETFLI